MALLLLDLDGTVREPLDGHKFIEHPQGQQIIAKAQGAIAYFQLQGWQVVGITNQAGVAAGHKSLKSCISEQAYTLTLLPLAEIYFCPDFQGKKCYCVTRDQVHNYSKSPGSGTFRKPGPGMLNLAIEKYHPDTTLMVGDSPEDRAAARAARIRFQQAQSWRQMYGDGCSSNGLGAS